MERKNILVIDYKKNGNDIKKTIKPCFKQSENVYTFIDRYDNLLDCNYISTVVLFEDKAGLVVSCNPDRDILYKESANILRPEFLGLAERYKLNFFNAHEQAAKEDKHIKNTVIELYKILGRPVDHLLKSRSNFQKERLKAENEKILQREKQEKEAEKEENERLINEIERFKQGKFISSCDFLSICKLNDIDIHIRTKGQINSVVTEISRESLRANYPGKRKPKFDNIWNVKRELETKLSLEP